MDDATESDGLSRAEVARRLGVSKTQILRMEEHSELTSVRDENNHRRYDPVQVAALQPRQTPATATPMTYPPPMPEGAEPVIFADLMEGMTPREIVVERGFASAVVAAAVCAFAELSYLEAGMPGVHDRLCMLECGSDALHHRVEHLELMVAGLHGALQRLYQGSA